MAGAAVLSGLANLLLLADLGSSGAIAARFITGIALAGVYPPAMKFIATWFKTGRGLAMGVMVGALTLGSAMPHLFRASSDVHWELVVLICSLGSFAAAAIFGGMLHEGPYRFRRTSVDLRQIGAILRNGPVILANIGYFGHMWELYAMWAWFLAFATSAEQTGTGVANASLLTFAVIAIGLPGCAFGGWLADRIGRCLTTMLMMGLSGFSAFLIGFAYDSTAWAFVLVALVWGFTVIADSAQFSAAITELSEPHLVGSSLAFQMGVGFALTIIVIWLIPLLAEALGSWRWTFLLLVPGPLIGVLAMGALWKHPRAFRMAGGNR
jgi:MFS family permease